MKNLITQKKMFKEKENPKITEIKKEQKEFLKLKTDKEKLDFIAQKIGLI